MEKHESPNGGILLKSGTNEVEFIEFYIAGNSYGINVSKVQRVIALASTRITKVAQAPDGVIGVIHVQEKPVLFIDLRRALNIQGEAADPERQMVLVAKFNKTTTAYLIDGVSKIHRTSWKNFVPMTEALTEQAASGYTTGTITIEGRIVLILDLERLLLDFSPSSAEVGKIAPEHLSRKGREEVHIVYAEDSRVIRQMTMQTLASAGFTKVSSFENGQTAYEFLMSEKKLAEESGETLRDRVDCIITDIEMPQMDGLTLCREVKSASGSSPIPSVVVYSSLINDEMTHKCKSVGADAQLSKPHGEEIIQLVDSLCLAKTG